ncbi:MAG: hypothetical protein AAF922_05840 [Pseudomonadota bacterium]
MTELTLRKIADLLAADDPGFESKDDARTSYYNRGRMLRDRGLIRSSVGAQQGRTTTFAEADAVAAAVMICANRDGTSWGILNHIHERLRPFENTTGLRAFEDHLEEIKAGASITIRVYVIRKPFPSVDVKMGRPSDLPSGHELGATKTEDISVDAVSKPIIKAFGTE